MHRRAALILVFLSTLHAQTVLPLPFFNHTGSASLDWIGESIAESTGDAMASAGVLVLDREDRLEAYRRLSLKSGAELTHASILKIGDALDASRVIYGAYELIPGDTPQSKGSLRVTARIIDLKMGRQTAPFSEIGAVEDLSKLIYRLGWQSLRQLEWKSLPPENDFLSARPAVRLDAVESYARGLLATAPDQRHAFFTRAARLDEKFSQPCFQLGRIYWEKKEYKIAADWFARVSNPDPHYMESQFYLGLSRFNAGDYKGAEQSFQTVSDAVPLNEVYNNLGAAQARRKDSAGAIASFRKAIDGDSADPDYHFNLGYVLWRTGQFPAAVESFRAVVERNPNDAEATTLLGRSLKQEGPRPGDPKTEARERLKTNYDERAYRQLQAELSK